MLDSACLIAKLVTVLKALSVAKKVANAYCLSGISK